MYNYKLHSEIQKILANYSSKKASNYDPFYTRLIANASAIDELFKELYGHDKNYNLFFTTLIETVCSAFYNREEQLQERDSEKIKKENWFLSNELCGMSLYVDRFAGSISNLESKLSYFEELGVNVLHLMPLFKSPPEASDGGYAVSDFRKIDGRFGTLEDLGNLNQQMLKKNMFLITDIVLNHTSDQHEWALKAKAGDKKYQDYFYMYDDRAMPNEFEKNMKEIFPEVAPGNFTWIEECNKWVMTVFHNYQWDLNYHNPEVFIEMLDTVFFYANIGVDILRIDAPAFMWKQPGTLCTNLPEAHKLLQLIRLCVEIACAGLALLGEAIQRPKQIMEYFGKGNFVARECDFLYKAPQMALQWDALATGDTRVMLAAQHILLQKPFGTSWITYTRCHDDIGLGYDDEMIEEAGYNAYAHRQFIKDYYSGNFYKSPSRGALFSFNAKTGDARISGTLASLCGLEKAIEVNDDHLVELSIRKILMMQAFSFFIGGLPVLFYGDEIGYINDKAYLNEPGKSYDNRWMHRPQIDWKKNNLKDEEGTVENKIYSGTKKLLSIRKKLPALEDRSNVTWITPHNIHVAAFIRHTNEQQIFCLFNFSDQPAFLTWYAFKENGYGPKTLFDHWTGGNYIVGNDDEYLIIEPFGLHVMEVK